MEPNNNPINPIPPVTPEPTTPPESIPMSPLVQPITAPPVYDPPQPQPQPQTQPQPQPQPQPYQMPQAPMQQPIQPIQPMPISSPVVNNSPSFKQPIDKKKITIIGVIVALAILVIVGIMVIPNMITAASLPLEKFSNDDISIMVPKSYDKPEDEDSDYLTFSEPNEIKIEDIEYDEDYEKNYEKYLDSIESISSISVYHREYDGDDKEDIIEDFDDEVDKSSIKDSYATDDEQKIDNFKVDKSKKLGSDARTVTADILENKKLVRRIKIMVIFAEDDEYMVTISAHKSDAGLIANIDNILGSFKIEK